MSSSITAHVQKRRKPPINLHLPGSAFIFAKAKQHVYTTQAILPITSRITRQRTNCWLDLGNFIPRVTGSPSMALSLDAGMQTCCGMVGQFRSGPNL